MCLQRCDSLERAWNTARALLFLRHFPPIPTVNGAIFSSPISCRLYRRYFTYDWQHHSPWLKTRFGENVMQSALGLCAARWPIQALKYVRRNWIVISTLKLIHASLGRELCVSSTAWRLGQRPFFSANNSPTWLTHPLQASVHIWSSSMLSYMSNCIQ